MKLTPIQYVVNEWVGSALITTVYCYNYVFILYVLFLVISQWYDAMISAITHSKWPVRQVARDLISLVSSTSRIVMELIKRLCIIISDIQPTVSVSLHIMYNSVIPTITRLVM